MNSDSATLKRDTSDKDDEADAARPGAGASRHIGGRWPWLKRLIPGNLWLLILLAALGYQFWLGVSYDSNDTTNLYLQLGRGASYAVLVLFVVLWLPVLRNLQGWLRESPLRPWLPLDAGRGIHRSLGHALFALAMVHGSQYLIYYDTLDRPYAEILFGSQPDIVRAMHTTMYEAVTEDESIELIANWIARGAPEPEYHDSIRPVLKEDCTKCHVRSSTMSDAAPWLPLTDYEDVIEWIDEGIESRQFRVNMSGIAMLLALLAIWIFALHAVRSKRYHLFQWVHRLGYLCAILMALHMPERWLWLVAPLALLALELALNHSRRRYRNCPTRSEWLDNDVLRLHIELPRPLSAKPGDYVQIRLPELSGEWHAFSLTRCEAGMREAGVKIRIAGDWTERLAGLVATNPGELCVELRGPYASPTRHACTDERLLLVAGGIGITPFLSLLRLLALDRDKDCRVHLLWMLRGPGLDRILLPILQALSRNTQIRVSADVFYTVDPPEELPVDDSDHIHYHAGFPDWSSLLPQIGEQLVRPPNCYVCGPPGLMKVWRKECARMRWHFRVESF